jgi:hypothetical protein
VPPQCGVTALRRSKPNWGKGGVLAREAQQQPEQQAAEEKSRDRYSGTSHEVNYAANLGAAQ